MFQGLLILAQNPISVFAHNGQTVKHHRLPAGQNSARAPRVKVARQAQINIEIVAHGQAGIDQSYPCLPPADKPRATRFLSLCSTAFLWRQPTEAWRTQNDPKANRSWLRRKKHGLARNDAESAAMDGV